MPYRKKKRRFWRWRARYPHIRAHTKKFGTYIERSVFCISILYYNILYTRYVYYIYYIPTPEWNITTVIDHNMYARHRHGRRRRGSYHRQTLLLLLHIIIIIIMRIIPRWWCIARKHYRHNILCSLYYDILNTAPYNIFHIVAYRSQSACTVSITRDYTCFTSHRS